MSNKRDLQPIIQKVRTLHQMTEKTGVSMKRSIARLMADLTPDETVEVVEALNLNTDNTQQR